jgi:hypothetical protein
MRHTILCIGYTHKEVEAKTKQLGRLMCIYQGKNDNEAFSGCAGKLMKSSYHNISYVKSTLGEHVLTLLFKNKAKDITEVKESVKGLVSVMVGVILRDNVCPGKGLEYMDKDVNIISDITKAQLLDVIGKGVIMSEALS